MIFIWNTKILPLIDLSWFHQVCCCCLVSSFSICGVRDQSLRGTKPNMIDFDSLFLYLVKCRIFPNNELWILHRIQSTVSVVVVVQVVSLCRVFLFLFHPGTVLAVRHGRLISWPLLAWDLCSNCGSKPRHGGHWYIPWESTGYPKVIIAATWIFVLFCSLDDFPGYLFSNGGQCVQSFLYFCFPPSARILLIIREGFFFLKVNCKRAQPNGKGQHRNKTDQVFLFWNCVYSGLHVARRVSMNNRRHNLFPEIASRPCWSARMR